MMKILVFTLTVFAVGKPTESVVDKCSDEYRLVPGARVIRFSTTEKAHIVEIFNSLQNDALGTVVWDDTLAQLADLNVRQVANGNFDENSVTDQNFAYGKSFNHCRFNRKGVINEIDTMISDLFTEHKDASPNMNPITRNVQQNAKTTGDFTVMSAYSGVGCAAVWYPDVDTGTIFFGCNY